MTTAPSPNASLDENTATVIQQALAAARSGRLADACGIAERGLASGADRVALNALLGMLRLDLGDVRAAINHLELARSERPFDLRIATNLATALISAGDMERALEVASPELAFADPSMELARIRGFAADQLERLDVAIEAYDHVVRASPGDWETLNNLGNARVLAGDVAKGVTELERAVSLAPDSAPSRLNLARAHREAGEFRRAEEVLRQMAADFPDDPKPLIDLHDLLKIQLREDGILEVLNRAIELEPDSLELLLARARHHGSTLDLEPAERDFHAVLERDPANAEAFVGLATLYERGRPEGLPELAERAEQQQIEPNAVHLLRAFAHRRAKRFAEGIAEIEKVDPDYEGAAREHLVGEMLDKLGDFDGAFAAFERMNQIQSEDPSHPLQRAEMTRALARQQLAATTRDWAKSWAAPPVDPEARSPAFLVGFPRSGTTLLDTILMGHPDTVVMEEEPVIRRLKQELGSFEAIATLDAQRVRDAQKRYFEIAAEYADLGSGQLLIDKSPLLLNEAALIHRLFPNAPFLLAIRHPADVLLSCYISNFNLNHSMVNFLRLDSAAEFYDLTFTSWENARDIFPLTVHRVTYEEMVEDPPAILRPVVEAIGLEWNERMLDHTKTAAERGLISTASYAQVTEPIYKRSVGRWKNYRKHLEPVLPVLAPWAEKFGYTL